MAYAPVPPPRRPVTATVEAADFAALKIVVAGLVAMRVEDLHAAGHGPRSACLDHLAETCRALLEAVDITAGSAPADKTKAKAAQRLAEFFAGLRYDPPDDDA